jgi:glycosyltransferase involved in cell wall biosynthesis
LKKILIVSTVVPFVLGGGELIVDWLDETLKKYGYKSDVIKIPFRSCPPDMLEQMLALRLLDVGERADTLIAIRTPSYLIRHPNKVVWFIHHHRGAYDLWGTPYQDIPGTLEGLRIKESIVRSDNVFLREAKKIYTNSRVVSHRLKKFNDISSEVLYPPLMNPEEYRNDGYGDYIFYPSRLTHHKRQYLAIEAMKYTQSGVRLVTAGHPESPAYLQQLESTVLKNNLSDKVKIISRWITHEEKIELFSNSLACAYIPFDEDSYGYVSLEAFHSRKSVITCNDSGGTLEIVEDGVNGFIAQPEPMAIAECFDRLFLNNKLAERMGHAGYDRVLDMDISWDHVVEKLVK